MAPLMLRNLAVLQEFPELREDPWGDTKTLVLAALVVDRPVDAALALAALAAIPDPNSAAVAAPSVTRLNTGPRFLRMYVPRSFECPALSRFLRAAPFGTFRLLPGLNVTQGHGGAKDLRPLYPVIGVMHDNSRQCR
jgi:hypothetical protein